MDVSSLITLFAVHDWTTGVRASSIKALREVLPGAQFAFGDGILRFLSQSMDNDMDPENQRTRTDQVDSSWERLLSRKRRARG